ncbi:GNAT family N-acetyltransferase [Pelomyxa schiedti]|nr:GNAT family N-acetyltransferase [Pelomyxa schiedti]
MASVTPPSLRFSLRDVNYGFPHGLRVRLYDPSDATKSQADFSSVSALWMLCDLGNPTRGDNKSVVDRCVSMGGGLFIVEEEPRQVGDPACVSSSASECIATAWVSSDGRRLFLHHFGVTPGRQRQGIGRALLKTVLDCVKRVGMQVRLEVARTNTAALALYTSAGFAYLGDYLQYIIRDISKIPDSP